MKVEFMGASNSIGACPIKRESSVNIRAISLKNLCIAALCAAGITLAQGAAASTCAGPLSAQVNQRINPNRPSQELFNAAVIHYMNAERCRRGLSPFAADSRLLSMAATHSRNMARDRNFSHQSGRSGQQNLSQRLRSAGVRASTAGENIAMEKVYAILGQLISTKTNGSCQFTYSGSGNPVPIHSYNSLAKEVVARLMNSSKHRNNILNPRFVRGGSGIGVDPGGSACGDIYVTQDFAS